MDGRTVLRTRKKFRGLKVELSEHSPRRWAAVEVSSLGRGGIYTVSEATGLAHSTIRRGICELNGGHIAPVGRQRRLCGGRKSIDVTDPGLKAALDGLDGGGRVIVRDPWGKGTRYLIDWSEFVAHWAGDIVNWGGK